jgi:hypothetical protein
VAGCASASLHDIVEKRDLDEAARSPAIEQVWDLGGGDVPANGQLRPRPGDGVAVIGEALWIRGASFGREPTVTIGGRPAPVLSRTGDGGILARVPVATPAGRQALVVSHDRGEASHPVEIRRFAAALRPSGGHVAFAAIGADGPVAQGGVDVAGAAFLDPGIQRRLADLEQALAVPRSAQTTTVAHPDTQKRRHRPRSDTFPPLPSTRTTHQDHSTIGHRGHRAVGEGRG